MGADAYEAQEDLRYLYTRCDVQHRATACCGSCPKHRLLAGQRVPSL